MDYNAFINYAINNKKTIGVITTALIFVGVVFYLTRPFKIKKLLGYKDPTTPIVQPRVLIVSDKTETIYLRNHDVVIIPEYITKNTLSFDYFMDIRSHSVVVRNNTYHDISIINYVSYYLNNEQTMVLKPTMAYKLVYNNNAWTYSTI